MMLSDQTIRQLVEAKEIAVTPQPEDIQFQPVSLDLRLGTSFHRLPTSRDVGEGTSIISSRTIIRPGEFLLAATQENLLLPDHISGVVHGKSMWARRGLMVEAAGLVDPGFDGTITLELKNLSALPLTLTAGVPICQVSFHLLDTCVLRPYGSVGLGSHYQGQVRATPASEA